MAGQSNAVKIGKMLGTGVLNGFTGELGGEAAKALMGALGLAPEDPNTQLLEKIDEQLQEVNQNLKAIESELEKIEQTLIRNQDFNTWMTIYRDSNQSFFKAKVQIDFLFGGLVPRKNGAVDVDNGMPTWCDLTPQQWAKKVIEGDGTDEPVHKLLLAIDQDVTNTLEGQNLIDTYVQVLIDRYCTGSPSTSTPWQPTYGLLCYLSQILNNYWRGTAVLKAAVLLSPDLPPQQQATDIAAHVASYITYVTDMEDRSRAGLFRILSGLGDTVRFAEGCDLGVLARELYPAWGASPQPYGAEVDTRMAQTSQYAWGSSLATLEAMFYDYQPAQGLIPAGGKPQYKIVLYSIVSIGDAGWNNQPKYENLKSKAHLDTLQLTGGQIGQFTDYPLTLARMAVRSTATNGYHWYQGMNGTTNDISRGGYADRYAFWLDQPGTYHVDENDPQRPLLHESGGYNVTFLGSAAALYAGSGFQLDDQSPFAYGLLAAYAQNWEESLYYSEWFWSIVSSRTWWRRLVDRFAALLCV